MKYRAIQWTHESRAPRLLNAAWATMRMLLIMAAGASSIFAEKHDSRYADTTLGRKLHVYNNSDATGPAPVADDTPIIPPMQKTSALQQKQFVKVNDTTTNTNVKNVNSSQRPQRAPQPPRRMAQ